MAEEELQTIQLKNDFYRDGFYKVLTILLALLVSIALLISVSIYLFLSKPNPVIFATDNEWRVFPPVPLSVPYIHTADLLQWTSDAVTTVFTVDFVNYTPELKSYQPYFTVNGWQKFLEQVNLYANFNIIQSQKLFLISSLVGAPYILKQGLIQGVYGWWIQMPLKLSYSSAGGGSTQQLTVQALVVRVPTLNNLRGVAIENMIVTKAAADNTGSSNG